MPPFDKNSQTKKETIFNLVKTIYSINFITKLFILKTGLHNFFTHQNTLFTLKIYCNKNQCINPQNNDCTI